MRVIENLHILLWLIKDTCWALVWRPGGVIMVAPTIGVAVYILIKSVHHRVELFHNIAVCMWITANSTWMIGEFFGLELRPLAVVFFSIGLAALAIYYIFFYRADKRAAAMAAGE